jgi:hypothetical protein
MAVGETLPPRFGSLNFNLQVICGIVERFPVDQVGLNGGMGVMAHPTRETFLSVPVNMAIVQVYQAVSEASVHLGELIFHQRGFVTLETKGVGIPGVGRVFGRREPLDRERFLSDVDGVTVSTVSVGDSFVPHSTELESSLY